MVQKAIISELSAKFNYPNLAKRSNYLCGSGDRTITYSGATGYTRSHILKAKLMRSALPGTDHLVSVGKAGSLYLDFNADLGATRQRPPEM